MGHVAGLHHHLVAATVGSCEPSDPTFELPVPTWLPMWSLHQGVQEQLAALVLRVVALVPPDFLGFFFENQ